MNKEKIKQELQEKYPGMTPAVIAMVNIMLDAIELSRQDDWMCEGGVIRHGSGYTVQVHSGSLVVCPECGGKGQVHGKDGSGLAVYCDRCNGYGSVKAECNTPSA